MPHPCVHSPVRRATAALLAALLTLAPALRAAAARAKTQVLQGDAGAQARTLFGRAAELEKKSKHGQAAETLEKGIAVLTSRPLLLDEDGGRLLAGALIQLAVDNSIAGDDERSDKALAQLVRLSPDHVLSPSDYPPAFLLRLEGMRKHFLAEPRGSLRVLAPKGPGETRILLDGRPFIAAPVLIKGLIPGEHFVRAERGGAAWADKVVIIAGAETRVAPQPGVDGPVADLSSMQDADAGGVIPEVQGAPAPVVELPKLVSEAPAPSRRVAMPGAPVTAAPPSPPPPPADTGLVTAAPKAPLPEPPSRALVIPREPTRDADAPAAAAKPRTAPAPEQRIAALEPDAIKTAREPPAEKKNHALLWVLAGALLLGGLAAGGYYLYESGQTPTSSTVTATWTH
jgi:hypothetical protein